MFAYTLRSKAELADFGAPFAGETAAGLLCISVAGAQFLMSLVPPGVQLSEDEFILVQAAYDFAKNELLPLDRKWDKDESSVAEALPALSEMGFLNLFVPEELNGLGCSYRVYAAILGGISVWSPSTGDTISVHSLTGKILLDRAAEPLRTELLSHWGDPGNFAAFALSEAGAGSDAGAAQALAEEVDGGFRVTGEKMWITNGMAARWLLTLVRIKDTPGREGLCALLIDGNSPGVERTHIRGKMGIRGSETAVIGLNDVFVPEDHLIGERGKGLQVMLSGLNEGRIGIAAQAAGIAEACLDEMVAYAREREQFGRPIGKLQAVANMIADSAVELQAARELIWRAASLVDAGRPDPA
ncbi:MAG: acyl-CoA dehydrogenase family protein, partial [Planctomycetes bacterium]|nr:acyl-CoA dehydrogenase family protein [Planctomycetota bacterium]